MSSKFLRNYIKNIIIPYRTLCTRKGNGDGKDCVCPPTTDTNKTKLPPPVAQQSFAMEAEGKAADGLGRPKRLLYPGKVVLGFIPINWQMSFYEKTGFTGFYTFMFTFGTYLLSKEKLVIEHNVYGGISIMVIAYIATTKIGPYIAEALDKEVDAYETSFTQARTDKKEMLESSIIREEQCQNSSEGQLMLLEAKKENVAMQLEANYRERQMLAYAKVKQLLDYQVALEDINRRMAHRNIIDYVTREVLKSITPEKETEHINICIDALSRMASKTPPQSKPEIKE